MRVKKEPETESALPRICARIKPRAMELVQEQCARMGDYSGGHVGYGPALTYIILGFFGETETNGSQPGKPVKKK